MNKLTEAQLQVAAAGNAVRGGDPTMARLRAEVAGSHPNAVIRMDVDVARAILSEADSAKQVAMQASVELLGFRRNVREEAREPPAGIQSCLNCASFAGVKRPEGHLVPDSQAIVSETGACRANPPTAVQRGAGDHSYFISVFPPVHPENWCAKWEKLRSLRVPHG